MGKSRYDKCEKCDEERWKHDILSSFYAFTCGRFKLKKEKGKKK